jgi:hypothetical protein
MKIVYEILEDLKEGLTKSELETFHKVITHIKNKAEQI